MNATYARRARNPGRDAGGKWIWGGYVLLLCDLPKRGLTTPARQPRKYQGSLYGSGFSLPQHQRFQGMYDGRDTTRAGMARMHGTGGDTPHRIYLVP